MCTSNRISSLSGKASAASANVRISPKCISIWGVERIEIATMAQKSHRMGDIGCPAALAYIIVCQLSKYRQDPYLTPQSAIQRMINTNMGRDNHSNNRWELFSLKQFTIYKPKSQRRQRSHKRSEALKRKDYKFQEDCLGLALENVHVHGICTHSHAYVHQVYAAVCQAH